MKRWTLRMVMLLILGAIVNVAVAWGCVQWSSMNYELLEQDRQDAMRARAIDWARSVGFTWMEEPQPVVVNVGSGFGVSRESVYPYSLYAFLGATRESAGLPLRSLNAHFVRPDLNGDWSIVGGISLAPELMRTPLLPLRPIWPGFAINTVFYAAILFALCFGFERGRRIIRLRRSRCPKCGYDLRGHLPSPAGRGAGGEGEFKGCPECGWEGQRGRAGSTTNDRSYAL